MALLRLTRDGVEIRSVDLSQLGKQDVVIGRAESADVRLDDRAVGRSHAVLHFGAKGVAIQKTSKFGRLTLNGQDVAEATIHEGDVVHLADYTIHIIVDAVAAKPVLEPLEPVAPLETSGVFAAPAGDAIPASPAPETKLLEVPAADAPISLEAAAVHAMDVATGVSADSPSASTSTPISTEETGSLSQSQVPSAAANDGINLELASGAQPMQNDPVLETERTAILPQGKLLAELLFKPGEANVETFVIQKNEVTIGRGSNCDVVLGDKKSSRKHAVIKRAGAIFVVRDLSSANGTYVNGELVTEKEIQGGDLLRIGDTEFAFKAVSKEYEEQQKDFLSIPSMEHSTGNTPQVEVPSQPSSVAYAVSGASSGSAPAPGFMSGAEALAAQASAVNQNAQGMPGIPGISGAAGTAASSKDKSLLAKFRKQPAVRRYLILAVVLMVVYYGLDLNKQNGGGRSPASAKMQNDPENAAFNALAPEKKQFVVNTYQLAFDLYTQEKYEESLYEIRKVLQILPSGYKQSKDIESYAQKAIEQLAEQAERKKRQENEERVRAEVASLVTQAQELVDKGDYGEARLVFAQILEKDPENPVVQSLKSQIDDKEEQAKAAEELKKEKLAKKEQMQKLLDDGRRLLKTKKYYAAIDRMVDAPTVGYEDEAMLREAKDIAKEARQGLIDDTKPFLDEAQASLTSGDLPKARDAFLKALKVDYRNKQARAGLEGVRKTLFERAQRIYTEGLIAESISNYKEARAKFGRCLEIAMPDDIYHGRCERKYKRYDFLDRSIAGDTPSGTAEGSGGDDGGSNE